MDRLVFSFIIIIFDLPILSALNRSSAETRVSTSFGNVQLAVRDRRLIFMEDAAWFINAIRGKLYE